MENVIKVVGDKPIEERDFEWYFDASHKGILTKQNIKDYENIMNSSEYHQWTFDRESEEVTKGFKEVEDFISTYGMRSELIEYMYDISIVDNYILEKIKEDDSM